jgi:hypothetical protein
MGFIYFTPLEGIWAKDYNIPLKADTKGEARCKTSQITVVIVAEQCSTALWCIAGCMLPSSKPRISIRRNPSRGQPQTAVQKVVMYINPLNIFL